MTGKFTSIHSVGQSDSQLVSPHLSIRLLFVLFMNCVRTIVIDNQK